jgi:AcrR family transcriptional regulator
MAERNPERTRRRLVEAAGQVVAERGFPGASVGLIAQKAGVSTGAIYAHFEGKDAVLFAVFEEHVRWFEEQLEAATTATDAASAIAGWLDGLTSDGDQFLIFVEFWSYAVRRPKLRRRLAEHLEAMREQTQSGIEQRATRTGTQPVLPPDLAAQLLLAVGRGLAFEKLTDPEAVPGAAIGDVVASLLGER